MHICERFEHLRERYRQADGSKWTGQALEEATHGFVSRSYVSSLRKGRIEDPGYKKLKSMAKAMGFSPGLWFKDSSDPIYEATIGKAGQITDSIEDADKPLGHQELLAVSNDDILKSIVRETLKLTVREKRVVLAVAYELASSRHRQRSRRSE